MTPPMTDEAAALEPCPFCGADESFTKSWQHENGGDYAFAKCSRCGAQTCDTWPDEARAALEWNRRANRPTPPVSRDAGVLVEALVGLNRVIDAMWNDDNRAPAGRLSAFHVTAITAAQGRARTALTAYSRRSDGGEEASPFNPVRHEPETGEMWMEDTALPPAPEAGEEARTISHNELQSAAAKVGVQPGSQAWLWCEQVVQNLNIRVTAAPTIRAAFVAGWSSGMDPLGGRVDAAANAYIARTDKEGGE